MDVGLVVLREGPGLGWGGGEEGRWGWGMGCCGRGGMRGGRAEEKKGRGKGEESERREMGAGRSKGR